MFELFILTFMVLLIEIFLLNHYQQRICYEFADKYKHEKFRRILHDFKNSSIKKLKIAIVIQEIYATIFTAAIISIFAALLFSDVLLVCSFSFAFAGLIFVVSAIKFSVLKEPLVWSDLYLLKEIFLCPRFYFGYVKLWQWLLIAVLIISVIALFSLDLSPYLYSSFDRIIAFVLFSAALVITFYLFNVFFKEEGKIPYLYFDACIDGALFSPLCSFFKGVLDFYRSDKKIKSEFLKAHDKSCSCLSQRIDENNVAKEHIVLVQDESFISLKRLELDNYEKVGVENLASQALLDIDYFGAYTMRSEFAVLTGINLQSLRAYSYDPYILAKQCKIASLATILKAHGFYCICVHPNFKRFYRRDLVMPNLGFDEFIGREDIGQWKRSGELIADDELFAYISDLLHKYAGKKVFVFAITMQGHGPYVDTKHVIKTAEKPANNSSLNVYKEKNILCAKALSSFVKTLNAKESLLVYGDHIPPLKALFDGTISEKQLCPDIVGFNTCKFIKDKLTPKDLFMHVLKEGGLYA